MDLLNIGANNKTIKSDKLGEFLTAIMYLAPHKLSGKNVCGSASKGCIEACLNTAGRGKMNVVQQARVNRTKFLFEDRKGFIEQLYKETESFLVKCNNLKVKPAMRLNGTSDLSWWTIIPEFFKDFPQIQHYNYTKVESFMNKYLDGYLPEKYYLIFSRSESNDEKCKRIINKGGNIAVVFDNLPKKFLGKKVFNADEHDLRFLDPKGVAGLTAKGRAKKDNSGFVVKVSK